jgi:U6 snRNA-associated Sm-like protein LSm1
MILLRDGRTLIGFLRSVDQFANLVLHKAIERIHVKNEYGDMERGIFIIRGENVVLLGEIVSRLIQAAELFPQTIFFLFEGPRKRGTTEQQADSSVGRGDFRCTKTRN